jgi:hypothetical protein
METPFDSPPAAAPAAQLHAAMARAFAQIEGAVKGKTNPAF